MKNIFETILTILVCVVCAFAITWLCTAVWNLVFISIFNMDFGTMAAILALTLMASYTLWRK